MKLKDRTDLIEGLKLFGSIGLLIALVGSLFYVLSLPQPWDLTEDKFVKTMESISAHIESDKSVTYGDKNVMPKTYLVASGDLKDFTVEYHVFEKNSEAQIAYETITNDWVNKLFNEHSGFYEIGNEGSSSGEAYNSMFYQEYSVVINEEINRVFIDSKHNVVVKVRVGAQYDAAEISRTLFELMEYK